MLYCHSLALFFGTSEEMDTREKIATNSSYYGIIF